MPSTALALDGCHAALRLSIRRTRRSSVSSRCAAEGGSSGGAAAMGVLLPAASKSKRQKVSLMSLGCPKNVVDGASVCPVRGCVQ